VLPSAAALNDLISACRSGAEIRAQIPTQDLFHERLGELVASRFSLSDVKRFDRITTEGYSGLLAARQRDAATAGTHFATAERLLAKSKLSTQARKLVESMFFAQKAYELYVRHQFSDALGLLRQSFAIDLDLESDDGFNILIMHRIQLLNNWMRIEERRGRWRRGLALGIKQLHYLEAPDAEIFRSLPPPWNRGWNNHLSDIPAGLIGKMHAQIAAETASLFQDVIAGQTSPMINRSIARAVRSVSPKTQIGRWLDFQSARFNKTIDECCFAASAAVRHGSVPSSPLWLSIVKYMEALLEAAKPVASAQLI
jgi:hypothetical protein